MNSYDSRQIEGFLFRSNYLLTQSIENADLIMLNTCTIRQKAEQKALSFLGRTAKLKKKKPSLIIAVGGCLAQQYGHNILKRMPFIDLVFGTNAILRLPKLIYRIESLGCKIVDIETSTDIEKNTFPFVKPKNNIKVSSHVTIMRGCDNYCTYCVVPYVRGREVSRNPDVIVREIEALVSSGVKEIVLLGQNVNSYGLKEGMITFSRLLEKINKIDNLERIRFITSHPKDLSSELMDVFCSLDKLCSHIHLPVQSGDNIILKRMNRKYSREQYIDKVTKLRYRCPSISITSDFIVGFPGETNQQFESTLDLINTIRFNSSFAFTYSDRLNVVSSKFSNKITKKIKLDRLHRLLNLQNSITAEINNYMIGKTEKILVEGSSQLYNSSNNFESNNKDISKSTLSYWFGRTSSNSIVHFSVEDNLKYKNLKGNILNVLITKSKPHSLLGKLLENDLSNRIKIKGV